MNVKSVAGQVGERRARFALLSHSARPLAGHRSVSDFAALTKPRVMLLAVFTALVGLSSAPSRLDPLTTFAAVLAVAAVAIAVGTTGVADAEDSTSEPVASEIAGPESRDDPAAQSVDSTPPVEVPAPPAE